MTLPPLLPSTRLAIQVAAAVALSLGVVDLVNVERPYWVALTAVLVMVGSVGETLVRAVDRTSSTALGLLIGLLLCAAVADRPDAELALLFAALAGTVFLTFGNYRLMVISLTVMVVILLRLAGATDAVLLARVYDTAIGAGIAGLVSVLVLPLPTRQPVKAAVEAYVAALEALVDRAVHAMIHGRQDPALDDAAGELRATGANLDALAEGLELETALLGGRGRAARLALAALPALRVHVDALVETSGAAARSGLGREVADDLMGIRHKLSANLVALPAALIDRTPATVASFAEERQRIEARLAPELLMGAQERRRVVLFLNAMLALRRLNRALHDVEAAVGA